VSETFDVAIVGSGFAGSLLALVAGRAGRSVVLLEKGSHPRFAIGESSSPLANLLLEEIATRWDLPRLRPLATWGAWQRSYPELACGLKRGFSFFSHTEGRPFSNAPDRSDQLLVAASPNDDVADTHWYREEFDEFLLKEAEAAGVAYFDRVAVRTVVRQGDGWRVDGTRPGGAFSFEASFLLDASGREGALTAALDAGDATPAGLPPTQSLFTHFTDVRRLESLPEFTSEGAPPYPLDDAAVHHVFPGGWIWVLRFSNGITSAGVAAQEPLARQLGLEEGEPAWKRLLGCFPTVAAQFARARPMFPFVHAPRLAFRRARASGDGWALLPSAAAFADPLLSTGFPLALFGIQRLGVALEECWRTPRFAEHVAAYADATLAEADAAARLVGALYAALDDFPLFVQLTKLYFAAASYSEAARRLGKPRLAPGFLLSSHPAFGPALARICAAARSPRTPASRARLLEEIARTIEPFDVAGLLDPRRRNWFPVDADDLRAGAAKLEAAPAEIQRLLAASGLDVSASGAPAFSSAPVPVLGRAPGPPAS
jgi:tetracycline 7-halogenase / FADH2 O2-dependent halogenase